jgi:hypothetical protein
MRIVRWTQPLPDVLAVGASRDRAAALHLDGTVWQLAPSPRATARLDLPEGVVRAAICARGALVVVATQDSVAVWVGGQWRWVLVPDLTLAITDLRCAPDGSSFSYGYRTDQPWSDWGSVGWPTCGVILCDPEGYALWDDKDVYSRSRERPEPRLVVWGGEGDLRVYTLWGPPWCQVASREGEPLELVFDPVWGTLSPDGQLVGLLGEGGHGALLRRGLSELHELPGELVAIDLAEAPLIGLLRGDGRWEELVSPV